MIQIWIWITNGYRFFKGGSCYLYISISMACLFKQQDSPHALKVKVEIFGALNNGFDISFLCRLTGSIWSCILLLITLRWILVALGWSLKPLMWFMRFCMVHPAYLARSPLLSGLSGDFSHYTPGVSQRLQLSLFSCLTDFPINWTTTTFMTTLPTYRHTHTHHTHNLVKCDYSLSFQGTFFQKHILALQLWVMPRQYALLFLP